RVPIIFINKYFTQFIPGKQEGYATTTESLPKSGFLIHTKEISAKACWIKFYSQQILEEWEKLR
ncbi:MAG: hypothetical protein LW716_21480, partial [Microcystis sp. 53602_E8]|nr:hypothetical protein [Microcystis sp. 53602_E8]